MGTCLCIDFNTDLWYELAEKLSQAPRYQRVSDVAKKSYDKEWIEREFAGVLFLQAADETALAALLKAFLVKLTNGIQDGWDETPQFFTGDMNRKRFLKKYFDRLLPPIYLDWTNWQSMETMKNFVFSGIGQALLHRTIDGFCIDVSEFEKCSVRDGYEKYGGKLLASPDKQIISIEFDGKTYKPTDPGYERAAMIFRSTIVVVMTAKEHLAGVHLVKANNCSIAFVSHLKDSHPLFNLIKPHIYGTLEVNFRASSALAPYGGIVSRAFAFDEKAWTPLLESSIKSSFLTFMDRIEKQGIKDDDALPMVHDGKKLWAIHQQYITAYLETLNLDLAQAELKAFWSYVCKDGKPLTKENLIIYLTDHIFTVSAWHEFVGAIAGYLTSDRGAVFKIPIGSDRADIQTFSQTMILLSLTSTPMPQLVDDWSPLSPNQKDIVDKWQNDLRALSKNIVTWNKTRAPFWAFDPARADSSVAV
jgi:hypothetical protein